MRMTRSASAALSGLILLCNAFSAQAQVLPTDVDLKSAYCMRIKQRQSPMLNQILRGHAPGHPAYDTSQRILREHESDIHRLRSYLVPRMSSLDTTGLLAAANRADADMNERASSSSRCPDTCRQQAENGQPTEKWSACLDACLVDDPSWVRVKSCEKVTWLPF